MRSETRPGCRTPSVVGTVCLLICACGSPSEAPGSGGSGGAAGAGGASLPSGQPTGGAGSASVAGGGAATVAGSAGAEVGGSLQVAGGGAGGATGSGAGTAGADGRPRPAIPGTVLWLEAAEPDSLQLEAQRLTAWRDLSDQHNDAAQTNAGFRPTLVPATAEKPTVVHFTAAQHTFLSIADAPSLQFGKSDFAVALVFAFTNQPFAPDAPGTHLGGWAFALNKITQPSGPRVGWGIMGNWPDGETVPVRSAVGCETTEAGGSLLSKKNGFNDGALRLWMMRRVTARSIVELRDNGVVDGTAQGGPFLDDVSNVGVPLTLGGARLDPKNPSNSGFHLDGDIAAVVAVKGELSDADAELLEHYLMTKYRIAPP